jgi:hypothetical protein
MMLCNSIFNSFIYFVHILCHLTFNAWLFHIQKIWFSQQQKNIVLRRSSVIGQLSMNKRADTATCSTFILN